MKRSKRSKHELHALAFVKQLQAGRTTEWVHRDGMHVTVGATEPLSPDWVDSFGNGPPADFKETRARGFAAMKKSLKRRRRQHLERRRRIALARWDNKMTNGWTDADVARGWRPSKT